MCHLKILHRTVIDTYMCKHRERFHTKIESMIIIIIIVTIMNYKNWHDVINICIVGNAILF